MGQMQYFAMKTKEDIKQQQQQQKTRQNFVIDYSPSGAGVKFC